MRAAEEAKIRIANAKRVTNEVNILTWKVAGLMRPGAEGINFFGVFSDPHTRKAELVEARHNLDLALVKLSSTMWPKPEDWDVL